MRRKLAIAVGAVAAVGLLAGLFVARQRRAPAGAGPVRQRIAAPPPGAPRAPAAFSPGFRGAAGASREVAPGQAAPLVPEHVTALNSLAFGAMPELQRCVGAAGGIPVLHPIHLRLERAEAAPDGGVRFVVVGAFDRLADAIPEGLRATVASCLGALGGRVLTLPADAVAGASVIEQDVVLPIPAGRGAPANGAGARGARPAQP